MDRLFDEGVVRDVPVIGSLIRLGKTVGAVRDFIFVRKVIRFLARLAQIPNSERAAFVARLGTTQARRRVGETLLLLLDRLDDIDKPEMLARLFAAYVRGSCDFATFRKLSTALDRLSLPDLPQLRAFYDPERQGSTIGGEEMTHLAATGLVGVRFYPTDLGMTGGSFTQTQLGKLFLEVIDAA